LSDQLPLRVVFGGTFDPVHHGHLRAAIELADALDAPSIDLIPSRDPVHRDATDAPASARLAMLECATASEPRLVVNRIEIDSQEASYTEFTLRALRTQLGDQVAIVLVIGMDAFQKFESWRGWQSLLDLTHILVLKRPGYEPHFSAAVNRLYEQHAATSLDSLSRSSAGKIVLFEQTPLQVSATQVRKLIASGTSPRYLIPDSVWDYIQENELYGFKRSATD